MIINYCKICGEKFTRPKNPNRVFKYCSCVCMGKDKEKAKAHSVAMKGREAWNKGTKGRKAWHNISGLNSFGDKPWNAGKTNEYIKGEKNPNWKGGITPKNEKERKLYVNKEWSRKVYNKANGVCWKCGKFNTRKNSVSHHLLSFNDYKELRTEIENGINLCRGCHTRIHAKLNRQNKQYLANET